MRTDRPGHRRYIARAAIAAGSVGIARDLMVRRRPCAPPNHETAIASSFETPKSALLRRRQSSQIPQGCEQREAEQRYHADDESEREGPEPAAARLVDDGRRYHRRGDQRTFTLDHATGDISDNGVDNGGDFVGFSNHDAAETAILHEAIDPLVAPHHDMRDDIDPQPRRFALGDAAIEQIDRIRNLSEQRVERLVENFEPRHFGVTQVDDDAGTIGSIDPRLPERIAQPYRTRFGDGIAPGILRL